MEEKKYAKCECGLEMTPGSECGLDMVIAHGGWHRRCTEHWCKPGESCHDCNAAHGKLHHVGCDNERCPVCGGQLLMCDEEGVYAGPKKSVAA